MGERTLYRCLYRSKTTKNSILGTLFQVYPVNPVCGVRPLVVPRVVIYTVVGIVRSRVPTLVPRVRSQRIWQEFVVQWYNLCQKLVYEVHRTRSSGRADVN